MASKFVKFALFFLYFIYLFWKNDFGRFAENGVEMSQIYGESVRQNAMPAVFQAERVA